MADLTFYYGTMEAGKSSKLLQDYYNYNKYLINVVVFKPKIDTKGNSTIINRMGSSINVDLLIAKSANLLSNKYYNKYKYAKYILVDEAQFLSKKQVRQLWYIAHKWDINVICYGLKSNFKGELFSASSALFALADLKYELTVNCWCGKVGNFNARKVNGKYVSSGSEVVIDGKHQDVEYVVLCSDHYLEYVVAKK